MSPNELLINHRRILEMLTIAGNEISEVVLDLKHYHEKGSEEIEKSLSDIKRFVDLSQKLFYIELKQLSG